MATNINYIRGTAYWAKILGEPRKNNFDDYREWTIDVSPDEDGLKLFKSLGIMDRLKDPRDGETRGRFITLKQRELRADGRRNDPIKVVNAAGEPWPEDILIGNGSTIDVKFNVKDYGKGKRKGVYIQAIRVLELVPFERVEFAPLSADDEFFAKAAETASVETPDFNRDFDLDDDVPE